MKRLLLQIIALLLFLPVTLTMWLLAWLPDRLNRSYYPRLFQYWSHLFAVALGVQLRLNNHQKKAMPQQYILIANHPSAFEDIGIPALFQVHSLAKIGVKHWWVVGQISVAAGTLFVNRRSKTSRRQAVRNMIHSLEDKHWNIGLYPEGGCKGKDIQPFLKGAFEISLHTGIPILPVFLHYLDEEAFVWLEGVSLPEKIVQILKAHNHRADYHLFDAIDPRQYHDLNEYKADVHQKYLAWEQAIKFNSPSLSEPPIIGELNMR